MKRLLVIVPLLFALTAVDARAGAFKDSDALASATTGIALGPDGNLWVAEEFNGTVARVSPAGAVVDRFTVGGNPTMVAGGPNGTVWVTVPASKKLVWFDAANALPTAHDISTAGQSDCGPVAIADGGDGRMYFSTPNFGGCANPSGVGSLLAPGGTPSIVTGRGSVYDLVVSGGKIFAPDLAGDVVRRLALGEALAVDTTVGAAGGPNGIAAAGGNVYATLLNGNVARIPAGQNGGDATVLTPPPAAAVTQPYGVVAAPGGGVYIAGNAGAKIVHLDDAGAFTPFPLAGAEPFDVTTGPDGDVYFTDRARPRITRFVDSAPRATTTSATATSPTTADLAAMVDTRGNGTQFSFEYGPTTGYGKATTVADIGASAAGASPVTGTVSGLTPNTTYHVRAHATNAKGTGDGADLTFTTPAPAATPGPTATATPQVKARTTVKAKARKRRTRITSLKLSGLAGGETVKVTCAGKGCPLKSRSYAKVKAGTRSLTKLFKGAKLRPKARITVVVSLTGAKSATTTITIRKGRKPKVRRS